MRENISDLKIKLQQNEKRRNLPYHEYYDESDYINASWVPSFLKSDAYICTQGPKYETMSQFWQMVYEQNSSVIVMLTKLQEIGPNGEPQPKCNKYWPPMDANMLKKNNLNGNYESTDGMLDEIDKSRVLYENMLVQLIQETTYADFTRREFIVYDLRNSEEKNTDNEENGESSKACENYSGKKVVQYHYLNWEDQCSSDVVGLLDFHLKVKMEKKMFEEKLNRNGPIVIHCSAGVGRTGTFALLDSCLEQLEKHNKVNVCNMLAHLRYHRTNIVQKETQYEFIYKILRTAITARSNGLANFIKTGESFDTFENTLKEEQEFNSLISKVHPPNSLIPEVHPKIRVSTTSSCSSENNNNNNNPKTDEVSSSKSSSPLNNPSSTISLIPVSTDKNPTATDKNNSKQNTSNRSAIRQWTSAIINSLDLDRFDYIQKEKPPSQFTSVQGIYDEFHLCRKVNKGNSNPSDMNTIRQADRFYSELWEHCWVNNISLVISFKENRTRKNNDNNNDRNKHKNSTTATNDQKFSSGRSNPTPPQPQSNSSSKYDSTLFFPSLTDKTDLLRTRHFGLQVQSVSHQNFNTRKSSIKSSKKISKSNSPNNIISTETSAFAKPYKSNSSTPPAQKTSTKKPLSPYDTESIISISDGETTKMVTYWEVNSSNLYDEHIRDDLITRVVDCYMDEKSKTSQFSSSPAAESWSISKSPKTPSTVQNNNNNNVNSSNPFIKYILPALYTNETKFRTSSNNTSNRVSPKTVSTTTSLIVSTHESNKSNIIVNDNKSAIVGMQTNSQRSSMSSQKTEESSLRQSPNCTEEQQESAGYKELVSQSILNRPAELNLDFTTQCTRKMNPVLFIDEVTEELYQDQSKRDNSGNNSHQTPCNKNQWGLQIAAIVAITKLLSDFTFIERLLHYRNKDREVVLKYAVYVILKKFSEKNLGGNTPSSTTVYQICKRVVGYLDRCASETRK